MMRTLLFIAGLMLLSSLASAVTAGPSPVLQGAMHRHCRSTRWNMCWASPWRPSMTPLARNGPGSR